MLKATTIHKNLKKLFLCIVIIVTINYAKSQQRVSISEQPIFIPNGFVRTTNVVFFELDKQGSKGTIEKVIKDYNKYIVGKVAGIDQEARRKEDLKDKKGNPLDWELRMDIIYPEKPTAPRPVFFIVSTVSATKNGRNMSRFTPYQQLFAKRGYVTVIIDHANSPLTNAFGYNLKYYDLDDVTGVKVYTAAIRYLRANAAKYSIDPDRIGGLGHSKGTYAITRLSDPTISYNSKERFGYKDSYAPQLNIQYPSQIQVGYQSMGNGTRRSKEYVTNDYAPNITAVGFYDKYKQWLDWPNVVEAYTKDHDANWLGIQMLDKGHDMAVGFQPDLGYIREEAVEKFFSSYLEADLPPNILYVAPYNGQNNENLVPTTSPVTIHFAPQMNVASVKAAVKVIDGKTNQPLAGNWEVSRKDTYFRFTPAAGFSYNTTYKVIIGTNAKSSNGVKLSQPYVHTFTVNTDNTPGK